jgi:hypothetical protein
VCHLGGIVIAAGVISERQRDRQPLDDTLSHGRRVKSAGHHDIADGDPDRRLAFCNDALCAIATGAASATLKARTASFMWFFIFKSLR